MALPKRFNYKYLLELMYGAKLTGRKAGESPEEFRNAFLKLVEKDIRGQIENTLPIIYWVQPREIIFNLLNGLLKESLSSGQIAKYVDSVSVYDENTKTEFGTTFTPDSPGFATALESIIITLFSDEVFLKEISGQIRLAIESKMMQGKDITFKQLGDKAKEMVSVLNNAMPDISVICSIGTPQQIKQSETLVHNEIQKVGNEMRNWLRENTPAKLADAESFINNFNSSEDIIFISSNFKKAREETVNKSVRDVLLPILADYGIDCKQDLNLGSFTAAGHTGVVSGRGTSLQQVVGINSPIIQQTLYWANTQADRPTPSLDPFILETDHLGLSYDIKEGAVGVAKDLLDLNFSFVISQEASWNSSLGTREKSAMTSIVEKAWKIKRDQLADDWKKYIKGFMPELPAKKEGSPTLNERILYSFADILRDTVKVAAGKNLPKVVGKPRKQTGKTTKPALKNTKPTKASLNKSGGSTGMPMYTPEAPVPNITNLKDLINSQLQDVISANMGDGRSRNILNYRTGRFAGSAKVESLSISRQGMITAFYTYMKNPYATFSSGGKQSLPKSRDPKLLISKSIREIAQQMAVDKLRAVSL
jgi:hypothetical protein